MIVIERLPALVYWTLMVALYAIYTYRAQKGMLPNLRQLPAIDAMEEAMGRAAELGRPIIFTPGHADFRGQYGTNIMAGYSCLRHIMSYTAKNDLPLIVSIAQPEGIPMIEAIGRETYGMENKDFDTSDVNVDFVPGGAWIMSYLGHLLRERPAASIWIGSFLYPTVLIGETGCQIGAIQIGGNANLAQIPYVVALCDYSLMGEEVFVAGAYLDNDTAKLTSIVAQDVGKIICIGLVIVGVLLSSLGFPIIKTMLGG